MLTRRFTTAISFVIYSLFFSNSFSQENPNGDPAEIRSAILNSNNITTVMYNYGQYTRPNTLSGVADLVWKRLGYMFEFGPLFAAKVVNAQGDTLRIVDDGCWLPSQGDYSPDGTLKWGWLPQRGYARGSQPNLATSNNPNSWHTTWSAWPGEFGNGVVIGLDEAYYGMDDFTNAEFPYYPFPTDTTKRGLGVSAEVRTYQFGGNLADAIILKWKLKNESPRHLNECYFGFYGDPHIGGANDFADDRVNIIGRNGPVGDTTRYWARNTIYNWDQDGRGQGGLIPGYMSFKFLKTPNDRDLRTFWALPFTNSLPNVPKNDPFFYQLMSSDSIDLNQELLNTPGDNVSVFATGPFSLPAGDSTYISLAIFMSDNYQDMLDDATYIHFAWHWPNISGSLGQQGGDLAYRINLTSPSSGVVSGSVPITWQYQGTDPNAKVLVECSSDRGTSWKPIAWNHPVGQQLMWNTTEFRDGVNYSLRIIAHNADLSRYYYDVSDQRFTVNNPVNAQPELRLNFSFEGTTVRNPPLNISWVAEDADNPNLTVSLSYAFNPNGPFTQFHSGSFPAGPGSYAWDFTNQSNAPSYFLKVMASDGNSDTVLTSRSFGIDQERGHYPSNVFQHVAGNANADFLLQVVNPQQLTEHTYEMTFNVVHPDSAKQVNIRDLVTGMTVLPNHTFRPNISTPLFDGLKLTIVDKRTDIDTMRSKFNRHSLDSLVDFRWTGVLPTLPQTRVPLDWFVAFNSLELLPNGKYRFPGDTVLNNQGRKVVVCPFYIRNVDSMQAGYGFVNNALVDSMWRPGRALLLRPQPPVGIQMSYQVNMNFTETLRPTFGDTLWIYTQKAITAQDVFRFVADSNFVTGVGTDTGITGYELSNNYPNPFNPTTKIRYQLPRASNVSLKVFDILGREAATLVDEKQNQGTYIVEIHAANLASGVYFYRLQADGFVSVKKMLLLK